MPPVIRLPRLDGALEPYTMRQAVAWSAPAGPIRSRIAYAAAHVVSDPHATCDPLSDARLDWDATLGYRRYLWRSEEHTSELQSRFDLVCRLLLEKKNICYIQ